MIGYHYLDVIRDLKEENKQLKDALYLYAEALAECAVNDENNKEDWKLLQHILHADY